MKLLFMLFTNVMTAAIFIGVVAGVVMAVIVLVGIFSWGIALKVIAGAAILGGILGAASVFVGEPETKRSASAKSALARHSR